LPWRALGKIEMRVIDASALVKYFAKERGWKKVSELILDGVVSIELVVKEVANSLWKKVRQGDMEPEVALTLIGKVPKIVKIDSQSPFMTRAFKIALQYSITVYDALYIALAENRKYELITCDKKQAEVAKELDIDVLLV